MGEDERKKIAELYFGTDKAEKGLIRIEERLNNLTKVSENYIKLMQKGFGNTNLYKSTDISKISNLTNAQLKKVNEQQIKNNMQMVKNHDNAQNQISVITTRESEKRKTLQLKNDLQVQKSATSLYDKIADYAKTYVIYQGFNELRQSAQELVKEMVNVEYQMVQIDRVLNDSSVNINNYRDELIQLAYDYGNSFENVADITLRLAQAGFDAQESLALTEKTLLALNTAELNATQATDDMVAIMAQWGLMTGTTTEQAESYSEIIDKINITADNFPTTSADIMEAMKKTSSAFKLAGMDIDETIAIIVSAEKASQRGGKAIGTALSNISQQLKTTARIDVAKDLGIDFFKDENKTEYKDLIDILGELSGKMQQLKDDGKESSAEMQKLLEVFTVFRRNIGASLLGEMAGEDSTYQQVMDILGDSETIGYSMRENAKHMGTAKAALEQFNATLLQLKTTVWDAGAEDMFKGLLVLGTDLVKVLTTLVDTFGTIPTTLGMVTLGYSMFGKTLKGVNLEFSENGEFVTDIISNSKLMENAVSKLTEKYIEGTITTKGLTVATKALNAAYSFGLSIAITAVVGLITKLINLEEEQIKKSEERISKMQSENSKLQEKKDAIDNLIKSYQDLNSIPESDRTIEQQNKLKEIQTEITNNLKGQLEYTDELYNNYDLQLQKLKDISSEMLLQQKYNNLEIIKEQENILKNTKLGLDAAQDLAIQNTLGLKMKIDLSELFEELNGTVLPKIQEYTAGKFYERNQTLSEILNSSDIKIEHKIKLLKELKNTLLYTDSNDESFNAAYNIIDNALGTVEEAYDKIVEAKKNLNEILGKEYFNENDISTLEDYKKMIENISNINAVPDKWTGNLEEYKNLLMETARQAYPEFQKQVEDTGSTIAEIDTILSSFTSKMESLQTEYTTLTAAQQELNDSGKISVETFKQMIDQDLLQYLDTTNGKLSVNVKAYEALAEAERVAAIQGLQLAAEEDIKNLALGNTEKLSGLAKEAIKEFGNENIDTGNKSITSAGQIAVMNQEIAKTIELQSKVANVNGVEDFEKQANAILNKYANYGEQIVSRVGLSANKASRGATKTFEQQSQERIKIFKQEIDEYESLEKAWVNKYKKLELFGTSDLKFITHQRINRYNDYLNQIRNLTGISEEDRTDLLREYTSKRQELELEYFDLLKDQLEDQIDALEKANDEKIKLIEEQADAQIEALKKVEAENDRIKEKEEYERKRNELLYGYQGVEYWRQRSGAEAQRALLEAEQELAELDKDWEEKKKDWTLEDQIEEIENARDAQIAAIEEAQEVQIKAWKDAYQAQVNLYAETGQIIYDNSVINAGYLYEAYMSNFVNPLNVKLREISSAVDSANKSVDNVSNRINNIKEYLPGGSKFIGPLTIEQSGGYEATAAALRDRLNKIGKFHGGGLVNTAAEEALAIVRKNEVVLRPEWAAGLDKLVQQINNGGSLNNTSNNTNVNVYGNLANFDAIKVNERKDVANVEKLITQVLKDKFNINK